MSLSLTISLSNPAPPHSVGPPLIHYLFQVFPPMMFSRVADFYEHYLENGMSLTCATPPPCIHGRSSTHLDQTSVRFDNIDFGLDLGLASMGSCCWTPDVHAQLRLTNSCIFSNPGKCQLYINNCYGTLNPQGSKSIVPFQPFNPIIRASVLRGV